MATVIYARKEACGDVRLYRDRCGDDWYATVPAYYSNKPTRRNKWYTVNCVKYRLEWIS